MWCVLATWSTPCFYAGYYSLLLRLHFTTTTSALYYYAYAGYYSLLQHLLCYVYAVHFALLGLHGYFLMWVKACGSNSAEEHASKKHAFKELGGTWCTPITVGLFSLCVRPLLTLPHTSELGVRAARTPVHQVLRYAEVSKEA